MELIPRRSSKPDEDRRHRLARIISAGQVSAPLDPDLREFARAEGVLPLLVSLGAEAHVSLRAQAAVQLARRARVSRVLSLLAAEGIPAVVIKGGHVAYACYPDPALRPHVDTDLLIHPRNVEAARAVFGQSGHRLLPHVSGRFVMSQFHYVDGGTGGAHVYDVHWRIANPALFREIVTFDEVRAQAVPLEQYGPHGFGPSIPHALLVACVHRAAHHGASDRLIWLNDVRLLLRAASPSQLDQFCALADAAGLNSVSLHACARAADLFGDVSVPSRLRLRAQTVPEPASAYLEAPSPVSQIWLDLRALRTWRERAMLLREHLFPPRGYMEAAFSSTAPLPWLYATRILRGIQKRTLFNFFPALDHGEASPRRRRASVRTNR